MYFINHETKTTTWDDPRHSSIVVEASGDRDSISSLHDYGDLFKMFNIENGWPANGQSETDDSSSMRRSSTRGQLETTFSFPPTSNTRTPSPTIAPGPEEASMSMSQILASLKPGATSSSVSDSPAPPVDHSLRAVSAPYPQSPNEQTPAAHLATILQRPETGNAPRQEMRNGELSSAESTPSRTRVNRFVDTPQGQMKIGEPSSTESLPSRTTINSVYCLLNTFEDAPEVQTAPSQSSPPSFGSKTRSKAANGRTTGLQSGSDYKPRVTLAKGADSSLRKGPDDSLLLMTNGAWEGPDPALRRGPLRSNAKGPNPSNRSNRTPIM